MAEHLKPCPFCGSANIDPAEWSQNDGKTGPGCGDCGALAESVEEWNRRTAPVSAPIVEDFSEIPLPPLPKAKMLVGQHLDSLHVLYSADQVRQIQREAIATYAERIRQLERELSEHKAARIAYASEFAPDADGDPDVGSIHANIRSLKRELAERKTASIGDDPEFRMLLQADRSWQSDDTVERLIAYIDGRTAGTDDAAYDAKRLMFAMKDIDGFTTVEWDKYDYASHFASENGRDEPNEWDELMGVRMMIDAAMIAAAPTPKNSGKEEA
jgi:hypothetical protein